MNLSELSIIGVWVKSLKNIFLTSPETGILQSGVWALVILASPNARNVNNCFFM
jgi:hypothetical protein